MIILSQDGERSTTSENYSICIGKPYRFQNGQVFMTWAIKAGEVICGHYKNHSMAWKVLNEMIDRLTNGHSKYQLPPDPNIITDEYLRYTQ